MCLQMIRLRRHYRFYHLLFYLLICHSDFYHLSHKTYKKRRRFRVYLIEKASRAIASKTADILNLDEDRQEILEYGALNFLQTLLSVALIILFGILANSLLQILVLSLTAALLRQYSGGVHATSPYRCAALSVMIFGGLSLFVKHVLAFSSWIPVLLFQILTLSCVLILLYKCTG